MQADSTCETSQEAMAGRADDASSHTSSCESPGELAEARGLEPEDVPQPHEARVQQKSWSRH